MNINYDKKRIVAYLDVMGFKKMLSNTQENLEQINKYFNLVEAFKVFDVTGEILKNSIDIMAVSDAIVYSMKIEPEWKDEEILETLARFFRGLVELQGNLALSGIWVRGAVSIGDLFIDTQKSILVGKAFVDAYNLEQVADYPRIIIDPQVLKVVKMSAASFSNKMQDLKAPVSPFFAVRTLGANPSDYLQLDWFGHALNLLRDQELRLIDFPDRKVEQRFNVFFEDLVKRQSESSDVFSKTRKLLEYLLGSFQYNQSLRKYKSENFDYIHRMLEEHTGASYFDYTLDE